MTWLVILALAGWVLYLFTEIGGLKERVQVLDLRLQELAGRYARSLQDVEDALNKAPPPAPRPLPEASPSPEARPTPGSPPRRVAAPVEPEPALVARPAARKPAGPPFRTVARAWLEENGLAWAGGGALALGGLFLVAYAAQRGVFTPPLRIGAAVAVGAILLGASEWLLRRGDQGLAAAMAAGAGAATLYGAAWASYSLYGLIGAPLAAPLLAATSLGLLALSFRHGEPLALLALVGGLVAPLVAGVDQWPAVGLIAYLGVMIATGHGVAGLRRWGRAGLVTVIGGVVWALLALVADGPMRVVALAVAPVALAYAALEWRRHRFKGEPGRNLFELVAPVAFCAGAALLAGLWTLGQRDALAPAALGTMLLAGLSAYGVRRDLIPPPLQLAAYLAASALAVWGFRYESDLLQTLLGGGVILAVLAAGVTSAVGKGGSDARWAGGASAAALVIATTLAAPALTAWLPEAATAAGLLAGAAILARASADPRNALSPAIWIWSAGAAALAALTEALDPRALPAAAAAMALAVSLLHARLGWRGFAAVTLAASLAALTALLSPLMFGALQAGSLAWPLFAAIAAASAVMVFAAARITKRADGARASAEALSTAALVVGLAGAFLLLRPWGPGGRLDPFLEASLRTLLILVAGLTSALAAPPPEAGDRAREKVLPAFLEEVYSIFVSHGQPGLIGRWRGQALLFLGLLHGFVFQLVVFNPLVGGWKPAVAGPPVLDSLLVGYLAPALLLAAATVGRVSIRRALLAAYGFSAGAFAFTWQIMEARRLIHGPSLYGGRDLLGRGEVAVYAILGLLGAGFTLWLGDVAAKRRLTVSPLAPEIAVAGRVGAWAALGFALLTFGFGASPWWGPNTRPLDGQIAAVVLLALYAAGALATLALTVPLRRTGDAVLERALRLGGVALVFFFANLMVRWAFRGVDMRPNDSDASLETWAFSAVWGLYGFGLLVFGAARRSNDLRAGGLAVLLLTLAKIFLFDMARLDGVIRAASFLAVGGLLLGAAVLVRRLSGEDGPSFGLLRKAAAPTPD